MVDSFGVVSTLDIGDKEYQIVDLAKFSLQHDISRMPYITAKKTYLQIQQNY